MWRDSVEATHHFLPLGAIDKLEPAIRDSYLPALTVQVAESNGAILGFIGMKQNQVAMLFVADEARSMGVGSALLDWAKDHHRSLRLDVNEENPRAAVFYIRRGFSPVGRSETDNEGARHPLLHLFWESVEDLVSADPGTVTRPGAQLPNPHAQAYSGRPPTL